MRQYFAYFSFPWPNDGMKFLRGMEGEIFRANGQAGLHPLASPLLANNDARLVRHAFVEVDDILIDQTDAAGGNRFADG